MKRIRSIPATASQPRSSSPNSVRTSGREVAAPRVDVLAEQRDLFDAFAGEARHLGHDLAGAAALLAPTDGRDDAVGARRVAAHRHLHPRLERPLAVHRERRGEGPVVEPEASSCHRFPACAEPVGEMRDRARPERDVDVGIQLEDPVALGLRVAAADGDHAIRVAPLSRRRLAEVRGELGVGLLPDRARVEDDHIGIRRRRRLAEPELLEHALDPLRVVGVHLAAERGDEVSPHRRRVATGCAKRGARRPPHGRGRSAAAGPGGHARRTTRCSGSARSRAAGLP